MFRQPHEKFCDEVVFQIPLLSCENWQNAVFMILEFDA